ncbi:uncharacterized protein LOC124187892 [Neodiprion fabricii]|uniref:uncharacterized protein LOC124187892 n=1 Tax=Neodiprion fabricii TaxID=2872261 RepID=UPI001ED8C988|nr:uncharacterized protein LOC124187892 [Neodiprion fabricii]
MLCCVSKQSAATVDSLSESLREEGIRPRGQRPGSEIRRLQVDSLPAKLSREEDAPPVLLPCSICSRTFKPQSLEKHTKICERAAAKKRKPFDSAKQRIQGTDLAEFLPKQGKRRPIHEDKSSKPKTTWKQTHDEFLRAIRAARGEADDVSAPRQVAAVAPTTAPTRANEKGTCPTCNRQFGIKAYDRHVAWCKERATRLPVSPATNIAKERLEARINYRAPTLRNRRLTNREKYSPGSTVNISTASKMSPPGSKPKESASVPSCAKASDSLVKSKPAAARRLGHTKEIPNIPGPMKSRLVDRTNRPAEEYESGPMSTRTSSSNPRRPLLPNASPKSVKTTIKNTSPPPKSARRSEIRSSLSPRLCKIHESTSSEPVKLKINLLSVRGYNNPKVNDIDVNQDVIGMSVQPCNIHREHSMTSWKRISEEKTDSQIMTGNTDTSKMKNTSVEEQDSEKCRVGVSEIVCSEKCGEDDEFEKAAERHRQSSSIVSPKVMECIRPSEVANTADTSKLSWVKNIEELDKTYLIKESRDSDPDSLCLLIPPRKWKPIKNSPRVEFYVKDRMMTVSESTINFYEDHGNLDCFASPMNFNGHVNFTSTPVLDNLDVDHADDMPDTVQNLEAGKDVSAQEDVVLSTEPGIAWLADTTLQQEASMALELELIHSTANDPALQETTVIITPIETPVQPSPETFCKITVQNDSPKVKSTRVSRRKKKKKNAVVKLTPRLKPLDQTVLVTEQPLSYTNFNKIYELPSNPQIDAKQTYAHVVSPIPRSSIKTKSPLKHRKQRALTDCSESQSQEIEVCQRGNKSAPRNPTQVDSEFDSSFELKASPFPSPRSFLNLMASPPSKNCNYRKCSSKPSKNRLQASVEEVGTVIQEQEGENSRKDWFSDHCTARLGRPGQKLEATKKQLKHLDLQKKENRSFKSLDGFHDGSAPDPSAIDDEISRVTTPQLSSTRSIDTVSSSSHQYSGVNPLSGSLKPECGDRRRCGTYVIEKRSVHGTSQNYNPASDESLEDKPIEKRRKTDPMQQDLHETDVGKGDLVIGHESGDGYSLNATLTDSRNFLETTLEDDVSVDVDVRKIYDKYINNNFDYDSENTVGGSYSNEVDFGKEQIVMGDKDDQGFQKITKVASDSNVIQVKTPRSPERVISKSSCQEAFDTQRRIRRNMNILRGSTDSLVSMMDIASRSIQLISSSGCYDREICRIQPIRSAINTERLPKFLPEINQAEDVVASKSVEKKKKSSDSTYWEKASRVSQHRLINLYPPKEKFRFIKKNPKSQFLPPIQPGSPLSIKRPRSELSFRVVRRSYSRSPPNFNLMLRRRIGANQDYDPFVTAERQINELFADTNDQFLTEGLPLEGNRSPPSDTKVTQFPLSHSSAFVKYPSSPRANKRASVIAPPSEFDDFISDFSSDSTETNSTTQDFFINNLQMQTRDANDFDKLTEDCTRRVVIDKSKVALDEDVNANSCRGKTFVSSIERSRKILEKVSPKVVRPAMNRSHSVRSTRATSAPRAPERKSSLKKSISHTNDYSGVSNASNNNGFGALSGSNLSLSSMLSSEADIKRSNSVFDELLSSFEDDGSSFPSLKSFLKSDSVSTSMSSQVPDSRLRNGMISDEELSSPDSYKRQNHSKLSADSAYSSLNRKCSNHGRSTNDVGSRIEQEPLLKHGDAEVTPGKLKMSKFCHECGSRFPEPAKFCCECGVKRLVL